ncbi:abscisic acid ABA receptor [Colletotrichum higginsianum]|nr:abscisic acid ABA receptor [Colletotrichum higginsianum]
MDPHPLPTYLSKVLALSPPQSTHPPSTLTGPLTSHTGLAYLFLAVSADHPRLQVHSYPAIHWARAYISNIPTPSAPITPFAPGGGGDDDDDRPSPAALGLLSDGLAGPAVRACVTKDLAHVRFFLALLAPVVEYILRAPTAAAASSSSPSPAAALHAPSPLPPLPTCLLHGLAGTLYLLRLIRHWLVLTTPPLAPSLAPRLSALLDLQLPDGDWPSPRDQQQQHHHDDEDPPETHASAPSGGVGFTSGPQGLVISLLSLRPFFPALQDRIDEAVRRAREFLWARVRDPGSSREANLFRGVLGTAL